MDTEVVKLKDTLSVEAQITLTAAERENKSEKKKGRKRFADKDDALRIIREQKGKVGVGVIEIERPGLTALAAIDYLTKYHGMTWAGRVERMNAVTPWRGTWARS
jgi:hypothetical protein